MRAPPRSSAGTTFQLYSDSKYRPSITSSSFSSSRVMGFYGGTASASKVALATEATLGPTRVICPGRPLLRAMAVHAWAVLGPYKPSRDNFAPRPIMIACRSPTGSVCMGTLLAACLFLWWNKLDPGSSTLVRPLVTFLAVLEAARLAWLLAAFAACWAA